MHQKNERAALVKTEVADLVSIAPKISDECREQYAVFDVDPAQEIAAGILGGTAYSLFIGQNIVAVIGVAKFEEHGTFWTVSTPEIGDLPHGALEIVREYTQRQRNAFGNLTEVVYLGNKAHIDFYQQLGFTGGETAEILWLPFQHFTLENS